jgi:nucleoside-diphosphate-sugar epimerase
MNILIIGSEGFIGGFLIEKLMARGHSITGMDVRPERGVKKYKYFQGDILDPDGLSGAMRGQDLVINLAAKHHDFGISREEFFQINEQGTKNVLAVMSRQGIGKFIFFSTVAVYGEVDGCSSEATPVNPANDYGESKLAAERLIALWLEEDRSREALVIRPTVVFGPNNFANTYKLIDTIYKRRYVPVGPGDNIKSMSYVENLAEAAVFLMEKMAPGMAVYNYSDYDHLTSGEVIDVIHTCLGRKPGSVRIPLKPVLMVTGVVDMLAKVTGINFPITANRIKKLNMRTWHGSDKVRALGFKQKVSLKDGLKKMVDWYRERQRLGNAP